ncbi:MAG: hypothetical protein LBT88_06915, partial [Oscillospiraceae bacterium]|nr:hypothetical protein [Oscillospiraceae bacterium]
GNSAGDDGGGIYVQPYFTGSLLNITGNTQISDNVAGQDGGGIYTQYNRLSNLYVGGNVVFSDNRASRAYNRNPVDDQMYYDHIQATQWTDPFIQGYNNYDISYTNGTPYVFPADVALSARKTATGAALPSGAFSFTVTDSSGNIVSTAVNDANGDVIFPLIPHGQPGVHTYTVTELPSGLAGWTTDIRSYRAVVTVYDDGSGTYAYTLDYLDGYPEFTNSFSSPRPPTPPRPPLPPKPPCHPMCCCTCTDQCAFPASTPRRLPPGFTPICSARCR